MRYCCHQRNAANAFSSLHSVTFSVIFMFQHLHCVSGEEEYNQIWIERGSSYLVKQGRTVCRGNMDRGWGYNMWVKWLKALVFQEKIPTLMCNACTHHCSLIHAVPQSFMFPLKGQILWVTLPQTAWKCCYSIIKSVDIFKYNVIMFDHIWLHVVMQQNIPV